MFFSLYWNRILDCYRLLACSAIKFITLCYTFIFNIILIKLILRCHYRQDNKTMLVGDSFAVQRKCASSYPPAKTIMTFGRSSPRFESKKVITGLGCEKSKAVNYPRLLFIAPSAVSCVSWERLSFCCMTAVSRTDRTDLPRQSLRLTCCTNHCRQVRFFSFNEYVIQQTHAVGYSPQSPSNREYKVRLDKCHKTIAA